MSWAWDKAGRLRVLAGKISISIVAALILAHAWAIIDPNGMGQQLRQFYDRILPAAEMQPPKAR